MLKVDCINQATGPKQPNSDKSLNKRKVSLHLNLQLHQVANLWEIGAQKWQHLWMRKLCHHFRKLSAIIHLLAKNLWILKLLCMSRRTTMLMGRLTTRTMTEMETSTLRLMRATKILAKCPSTSPNTEKKLINFNKSGLNWLLKRPCQKVCAKLQKRNESPHLRS